MIIQGGMHTAFWCIDRWSYYISKLLTCRDSPRGIYTRLLKLCFDYLSHVSKSLTCVDSPRGMPLTFWSIDRWFYHPSKSLTCGDSPRGFTLDIWNYVSMILVIFPSHWLVVTRQRGNALGVLKYWSVILPSIKVVDLWLFAKGDFSLTFEIMFWLS